MQTRLIDHLKDAAGDALELFRDRLGSEEAAEAELIAALLHRGPLHPADALSEARKLYINQLLADPVIDLGGTKRGD
jgi:hypothetical protein